MSQDEHTWESFDDDSFVIMETGVLGFSEDISSVIVQIARVSGGEFLSAGGNKGLLWETLLNRLYSKELKYTMDPFDFRKHTMYTGRELGRKARISIDFRRLASNKNRGRRLVQLAWLALVYFVHFQNR